MRFRIPIRENYPHFVSRVVRHPLKALRAFRPVRTFPTFFWVKITNRCNLRCRSCGKTYGVEESDSDMDFDLFRKILDRIAPHAKTINLTGIGEPLCNRQAEAIFDEFGRYPRIEIEVITNGQLVDEKWLDRFSRMKCTVDFSIDGTDEETFRFNRPTASLAKVRDALERALELERATPDPSRFEFRRRINFVVMRGNMHQIPEVVDWADKYRCTAIVFVLMSRWGCPDAFWEEQNPLNYRKELVPLLEEARRKTKEKGIVAFIPQVAARVDTPGAHSASSEGWLGWFKPNSATLLGAPRFEDRTCGVPYWGLYFSVNGDATLCCASRDYVLGNARSHTLDEIWNGARMRLFRMGMAAGSHRAFCRTCGLLYGLAQGNPFDRNDTT